MVDASKVQVDLQILKQVSGNFGIAYEQLAGAVSALSGEVEMALGGWAGVASGAFGNVFGDVQTAWSAVNTVLDEIAGNLDISGSNYGGTDAQSASDIHRGVQSTGITAGLVGPASV